MSMSFQDFVEDVVVMLQRKPPADDTEIKRWLNANEIISSTDKIIATAKLQINKDYIQGSRNE